MIILEGELSKYAFNPYDPKNKIGIGGMGVVFKGIDLSNGTPVAIKVLFNKFAQNDLVRNKTILTGRIRIKHENLVQIFDFIRQDGKYHTISEFLEGETLEKKIKSEANGVSIKEHVEVMCSVLDGIKALHKHKPVIIHRDINPSNIMMCNNGRVAILDYGIARILMHGNASANTTIVQNGKTLGTYHYSPPEQILGRHNEINETSDIYSAGITLYEKISGKLPFDHPNPAVLMKMQVNDELPFNSIIPKYIFNTLQKATAKDQKQRYQSVEDFKDALLKHNLSWWKKLFM